MEQTLNFFSGVNVYSYLNMQVQGTHTLGLPIRRVWNHILDPAILQEVTPGVTQLIELEPNQYEAVSVMKIGPVRGTFKGQLNVRQVKPHESFVLSLSQNSTIGSAQADIEVSLIEKEGNTDSHL